MCAALTFAIWDLARLPECRKKAAEEIAKFFPSREDMTAEALKALPFLNAFLMESRRYHSVSGNEYLRLSPEEGCTLGGHQIPKRVCVTPACLTLLQVSAVCDPYCRARDPGSFPNPDVFDPERFCTQFSSLLISDGSSPNLVRFTTNVFMIAIASTKGMDSWRSSH